MTKPAARVGDSHSCPKKTPVPHHGGTIKAGSPNVTIGGQPAARVGDAITCDDGSEGVIKESNACLLINGIRAARIDDPTDHNGKIITGMGTVLIADGESFIEIGDFGTVEIGENVIFGGAAEGTAGIGTDALLGTELGPLGIVGGAVIGTIIYFYHTPPKDLKAFPDAKTAKLKSSYAGGKRTRWKDSKGKIYEWDSKHGKVELYDKNGKHLGEFDPETGEQTKPADKTRKVEK